MSTTTDMNPAIARAVEAFNDHDVGGFVAEFAADATFTDPVHEGLDKAETREYMAEFVEAFPDVHIKPERIISSERETAIEWMFRGTHEDEFAGIPATGETVEDTFVSIITVSDDGITSWTDYWDRMGFAEQVGVE
jgi:steroid delta-isomerase-like uncharacterized protein